MSLSRTRTLLNVGLMIICLVGTDRILAAGDLTRRTISLPDLLLGNAESDYAMSQNEYQLETGRAYQLMVVASGQKEYAFQAPDFFKTVHLRKVEAGDVEIKAALLHELEFEDAGEAEMFFTPLVPGRYAFYMKGLESKGMVGHFVVK